MVIDLLLITVIVCFIIDLSGIIPSIEGGLSRLLHYRVSIPRPFSCSLCMVFWTGLVYLIITGQMTITGIALVSGFSFFSKNVSGFLRWIQEALISIESLLYKLIR